MTDATKDEFLASRRQRARGEKVSVRRVAKAVACKTLKTGEQFNTRFKDDRFVFLDKAIRETVEKRGLKLKAPTG